jgi:hypothetical protein
MPHIRKARLLWNFVGGCMKDTGKGGELLGNGFRMLDIITRPIRISHHLFNQVFNKKI